MSSRGERIVYRDREEEAPRRTYTTVKRYQVPAETARSIWNGDEEVKEDKIVIRRERREEPAPARSEVEYKVTERVREREPAREETDYRYTERYAEREREQPRRDMAYRVIERDSDDRHSHYSGARSEVRISEREREYRAPEPEPERVREFRFERERDWSPPRRQVQTKPYDVERYSKETEYYAQPAPQPIIIREAAAPQPIIIREERREPQPIIIREERRELPPVMVRREEPHYEFIEREEVKEQSVVKRERTPSPSPAPAPEPQQEDYFYERRIREVAPRRRDESYDDRRSEVRPRDSASQYSSDDSYEYVRRERTYEEPRDRSKSPNHRRHLAEGALAGAGAAELLRRHRKSQGEGSGHRGRSVLGGAALGAAGAEVLSRVRSRRRASTNRSRSRSRSSSYDSRRTVKRDRKKKGRSRSRSKSLSRAQTLGGIAAVAAVGALAGYALKNKNKNKETVIINDAAPRRSRSRRRRASVDSYSSGRLTEGAKAQDPEHRNRRIAQAGLASAAAAGIFERVRSKSRGGKSRERSKSRVRQGVPIAAAGLGGAALAGLYEKNKANQAAKKEAIIADELSRGRRRRSRSRSRSVPAPYPVNDRRGVDDRDLIAYGNEPIHPERGYYSDEEPGQYRRRHGGSGSESSPDTRRRRSRSRSRSRQLAGAGAAAGVAAVAAHEIGKNRERSRQRERADHRRMSIRCSKHLCADFGIGERSRDSYDRRNDDPYSPRGNSGYIQPDQHAPYDPAASYPSSNYFPPPPTGDFIQDVPRNEQNPYPAYNPAEYAHGAQAHQPYGNANYGESEATLGAPYPNDTFAGDVRYAAPEPAHEEHRRGRDPENVSLPNANAGTFRVPAHESHASSD